MIQELKDQMELLKREVDSDALSGKKAKERLINQIKETKACQHINTQKSKS